MRRRCWGRLSLHRRDPKRGIPRYRWESKIKGPWTGDGRLVVVVFEIRKCQIPLPFDGFRVLLGSRLSAAAAVLDGAVEGETHLLLLLPPSQAPQQKQEDE